MSFRSTLALLAVLTLLPTATAAASQTTTSQESGNPINDQGSSYHYRTYIRSVTPKVRGLHVEVLEFADRLLITNHTGKVVTIYGYSGEPYARIQPDGSAEQNVNSPAVYLNTNFYAEVKVPRSATASATPHWESVDRTSQFEWHDHRIHWMSPVTPPEVKDEGKRTKIFNWTVPIAVGNQHGMIAGELFWVPENSKAPTAAIVVLVAIIVIAISGAIVVRRRRSRGSSSGPGGEGEDDQNSAQEAW